MSRRYTSLTAALSIACLLFSSGVSADADEPRDDVREAVDILRESNFEFSTDSNGDISISFASDGDFEKESLLTKSKSHNDKKIFREEQLAQTSDLKYGWSSAEGWVELFWDEIPGVSSYSVFRDDVIVGKTGQGYFSEESEPGQTSQYLIEGVVDNPVIREGGDHIDQDYPYRPVYNIVMDVVAVDFDDNTTVDEAAEGFLPIITPFAANQATQVQYTTFISDRRVSASVCQLTVSRKFGGDNRSWSASSNSFRTRSTVTVNWPNKKINANHQIGTTRQYNADDTLYASKTASKSGLKLTGTSVSNTSASFRLQGFAANPFCDYLNQGIFYDVNFTITKAGTYSFVGERRRAPHHESYIRADSSPWRTVLRKENKGFQYLTWGTGHESLSGSGSY